MSGELCPASDPAFEDLLFGSGQWLTEFRWWHAEIVVGAVNPLQQLAFGGLTGHDGRISGFQFCGGRSGIVQSQAGFTLTIVRSVAGEAAIGQDWPYVTIEVYGWGR